MSVRAIVLTEALCDDSSHQAISIPPFGGTLLHAFMGAIVHPKIEKMMEYRNLLSDPNTRKNWIPAAANEFGRLVNILK